MDISDHDARARYGVATSHESLASGERRFRLIQDDGTGYIRTEAPSTGAWQQSHFHRALRETYIVQSEWAVYAEDGKDGLGLTLYGPGGLFTSAPDVVHSVYLPAGAVIHTVKHGAGSKGDRHTDARTEDFDRRLAALGDEAAVLTAARRAPQAPGGARYTEEYRHFDTLIWQAPAWASAIFALSLQALDGDLQAGLGRISGVSSAVAMAAFCSFMSLTLMCFAFVLWRFRRHQFMLKAYPGAAWYRSAGTYTQSLITAQSGVLLFLALLFLGIRPIVALPATALAVVIIGCLFETRLRKRRGGASEEP
ncbi:MAG: hypothetical protein QOK17_561 [Sphingomonadales bacterium]|jgi:hypothetical protein|nr:hypothetical protein [Sphingomonadales bacterium]